MTVKEIFTARGITTDDIRWYCAAVTAKRLLTYQEKEEELTRLVWSGKLEDDLYNMEENFVDDLEEKFESGKIDEPRINLTASEIEAAKRKRKR
ncbi:MAG: hypothetical protein ACLFST_14490 [Spirochaetia bacterium]